MPSAPKEPLKPEQWAGGIYALTVVVPPAILAKEASPEFLLGLRYSPWIAIPIIGGFVAGFVLRRRLFHAFLGALSAYIGFWTAASWGSGSRATSFIETLMAVGVGILPVFLVYGIYRRLTTTRLERPTESKPVMSFWEVVSTHWKQVLLFGGAIVVLTVMIILDLNALEPGRVDTVRLWAPIISFYERFGYWPAVLFTPTLGSICAWAISRKLMRDGTLSHGIPPQDTQP